MHMAIPLCLAFLLVFTCIPPPAASKLLMAVWVSRHGSREPNHPHNEILRQFNESFRGHRLLTNIGTRQLYILGRAFREEYEDKFHFSPASIFMRAGSCARNLVSSLSFLYGALSGAKNLASTTDRPSLPFPVTDSAKRAFRPMYPRVSHILQSLAYHDGAKEDLISYSYKPAICPGMKPFYAKYSRSPMHKAYHRQAMSMTTPVMGRVFGGDFYKDMTEKLQTLRYGLYQGKIPEGFMNKNEVQLLEEARKFVILEKGFEQPKMEKIACHHLFSQIVTLFDYAIARDRLGRKFADSAFAFHEALAHRDRAYLPRYQWLKDNPSLATKLKAMVFQDHDDLMLMMLLALTNVELDKVIIPFAATLVFELHKDKNDGEYYVKIRYDANKEKLKVRGCDDSYHCPLKGFLKSLKAGMLDSDREFYKQCTGDHTI